MSTIEALIKRNNMSVFRNLYFRRRENTGYYETDWQSIDSIKVQKWGTIKFSIDDLKPNFFNFSGFNFSVLNSDGFFSEPTDLQSFFNGYLSVYRTMVKVEAGYLDDDGSQLPTNSTLFIGLLGEDYTYKQDNIIQFSTKHLSSVFQEFPADQIPGLGSTLTASEMVTLIRDYIDANSISVFQQYISLGSWYIATTTNFYNMATSTSLQNISVWDLMKKLAEAENYVIYVDRFGELYFQPKSNVSSTPAYHFSGLNDGDNTYGKNIMNTISIDKSLRKVFNRIKVKLDQSDTLTSYHIKQESWVWGDSSSSFRFGVRTMNYENEWVSSATAAVIAQNLFDELSEPKDELKYEAKFVPQLMVQDRVSVTYQSNILEGSDLWGYFLWDSGIWGGVVGYNINISDQDFRIIDLSHNLDNFKSTVLVRQI